MFTRPFPHPWQFLQGPKSGEIQEDFFETLLQKQNLFFSLSKYFAHSSSRSSTNVDLFARLMRSILKKMKTLIVILQLCLLILGQTATNDEIRGCVSKTIENGTCKEFYETCFEDLLCANQFDDIFGKCVIRPGTNPYDGTCVLNGYIQISNALLNSLFDCLVKECNILEGHLAHQVVQQPLKECMSDALLDSSKCWVLTRACDQKCIGALDVLEDCEQFIAANDVVKVQSCFASKTFAQNQAKLVADCMLQECI